MGVGWFSFIFLVLEVPRAGSWGGKSLEALEVAGLQNMTVGFEDPRAGSWVQWIRGLWSQATQSKILAAR